MAHGVAALGTTTIEGAALSVTYIFDGTFEGFLTAVFMTYELHEQPARFSKEGIRQMHLGEATRLVQTDIEKAKRVQRGIQRVCGSETFNAVKTVFLCNRDDAWLCTCTFIRYAMKRGKNAMNDLAHPAVSPFMKMRKSVLNSCEDMRQFIRFKELTGGIFVAKCNPRDNVVPLIMDYFCARFNTQPFIIFDEVHHIAGVYTGETWYLVVTDESFLKNLPDECVSEQLYEQAWKRFYRATTIQLRYNPELRMHFMPKRFWKNLVELEETLPALENC